MIFYTDRLGRGISYIDMTVGGKNDGILDYDFRAPNDMDQMKTALRRLFNGRYKYNLNGTKDELVYQSWR